MGLSVHLDIYVFRGDNISPPCGERHLMWLAACFQGKSHSPWRPAEPHVGRDALRAAGLTGAAARWMAALLNLRSAWAADLCQFPMSRSRTLESCGCGSHIKAKGETTTEKRRNIEYKQKQHSLICATLSFDCITILVLADFRQRNQTPPPSKHMRLICDRWYKDENQTDYDASEPLF